MEHPNERLGSCPEGLSMDARTAVLLADVTAERNKLRLDLLEAQARHGRYFDSIGAALEGVHQTNPSGGWIAESDVHAIKRLRAELKFHAGESAAWHQAFRSKDIALRESVGAHEEVLRLTKECEELKRNNTRLQAWVNDLHSGMFINCVYCGHRYGPDPGTPVSMSDVLKAHIETCPEHPMSKLKADNTRLKRLVVHCENCGADYAETGLEAGCSCRLLERIRGLEDKLSEWQQSHEGV